MARAGRSWEFLTQIRDLQNPDDATRLLVSASFARLGLSTLALEVHATLSPATQASHAGTNLRYSIANLPSDLVPLSRREALVLQSVRALQPRLGNLEPHIAEWRARAGRTDTFVAFDGNLVRRPRDTDGGRNWSDAQPGDLKSRAGTLVAHASALRLPMPPPIVIDGINPPWMFEAALEHAGARPSGYAPRITIVEPDWVEFIDGLSCADLSSIWLDRRVELFVGPDALDQFRNSLFARLDTQIEPLLISSHDSRPSRLIAVVREALEAQQKELHRLVRETDAAYAPSSLPEIAGRFDAARASAQPLRVLIPTSRYSTFVQHSASDLAVALRRAGHEAEVLIENADNEQLSTLAYRRAVERLRPDLVVLVNYPRCTLGEALPTGVPFVCWIQDAMPHLFDANVGRAQGPLDFLFGYTFGPLFDSFAYPIERAMPAAVVADAGKFHDAPVDPSLRARFECEIAMVTHHSETPDAMHARLSRDMTVDAGVRATMERVRPALPAIVEGAMLTGTSYRVRAIVERAARDVMGPGAPDRSIDQLTRHYALPMVDRIFRHQTLEWAAQLCTQRGWRLHLYGRGWNSHPILAQHAKGELQHDEHLRAAYQSAKVHLHAGFSALVHQRVMECALSGGLCLGRTSFEALSTHHAMASAALVRGRPDCVDEQGRLGFLPENHPSLLARVQLHERLGIPTTRGMVFMSPERAEAFRRKASIPSELVDPAALFGDLAQTTFWSPETFRQRLDQAILDHAWHERVRCEIRARVLEKFTYDSVVPRLIELVARGTRRALAPALEQAA